MGKTLLLISEKEDDNTFAIEVAITAGLSLKRAKSPVEGAKLIAEEEITVILADASSKEQFQALENAIQESVGLFSDKINSNAIHFISSDDLEDVEYLIKSPLFGHFILRNYQDPKKAGQHYGRIIKATVAERAFGLANLLKPGAKVQVVKLGLTSQKNEAVEAIKTLLVTAKFQNRMASAIASAVDELLMNAMFDAPVDDMGKQKYAATLRSTILNLEGSAAVEMHVGYDGEYVAISAIDNFGSLDKNKLLSHVSKMYADSEYKVKTNVAGAGIGLAQVFRTGGSFFFVSESRVRTEVTVFFKKTDSYKEFRNQFRFLSTQFYF
ncbi:MAG: hypothetical protein ABIQ95_13855 [Bdellovibrionia bacterium]